MLCQIHVLLILFKTKHFLFILFLTGILLCAKTKLAKTRLAALFADKTSAVVGNRLGKKIISFDFMRFYLCI